MTEIDRYRNALEDKQELLKAKFKKYLVLSDEITMLRIDISKMEEKLNCK